MTEVAIVGAGIAGTTLALACRQAGIDVRLYDRSKPRPDDDRVVELTANGTRVLQALGLRSALLETAWFPQLALVRSARTGFLLNQRPLGQFSEARYGAPCCLLPVHDLEQLLHDAARAHGIPIQTGVTVTGVNTDSATLTIDGNRQASHLAVAVATGRPDGDGAPDLSGLPESRRRGHPGPLTLIRGRSTLAAPDRDHGRIVSTWVGPGMLLVERPVKAASGGRQVVELTAVIRADRPDGTATEALSARLSGCHPHLRGLAERIDASYASLPVAGVAEHWHRGRTVLLGAMCHGAVGYPDLLPSAVLEDAWILSRMMERWEDEPHQGFGEYERFRRHRAGRLADFAASELDIHTLTDRRACWQRNLGWSLTSRFLPEIALGKLDWLYGYDCIRGFA